MSNVSNSLDKIFSFITSANMGFVLLFFLAIYPVYMWSVVSNLEAIPESISYNSHVISLAAGRVDPEKLIIGIDHCKGSECQRHLTDSISSQIAKAAYASIPKHVLVSLLGIGFVVFSASLWVCLLIGVKNNGKLILFMGFVLSIPAAIVIAGPDKKPQDIRFCSKPSVEIVVSSPYSSFSTKHTVPVCQHM